MATEDLKLEQIAELESCLRNLQLELKNSLDANKESTEIVGLDQPIGRLTRMDAMQRQQMAKANRRSIELRLRQVEAALKAVDNDEYGLCRSCGEYISFKRLLARPESPHCIECQGKLERRPAP